MPLVQTFHLPRLARRSHKLLHNISGFSIINPKKSRNVQTLTGTFSIPQISFSSATASSVVTTISNYNASFTYTVSSSAGSASRTGSSITVSGLSANQATTVTAVATGSLGLQFSTTSSSFLSLPDTPTLSQTAQTISSVDVTIGNYDAGLTYTISSSAGSASRSGNIITVTGLSEGQTITVYATASNASGSSAQGSISATSLTFSSYESIATVTVGSGGASSIEFTSIPGTYQHLQVRILSKSVITAGDVGDLTFNSDTGNNYAYHSLYGDGASAAAEAGTSRANIPLARMVTSNSTSVFGANIVDILDYANTSKNKTVRTFKGEDRNGSGVVLVDSGLWMSTSAITSIKIAGRANNFAQYSTAALYGIRS